MIEVLSLLPGDDGDFELTLTRMEFNEICADLFEKMIKPIDRVLEDAGYN